MSFSVQTMRAETQVPTQSIQIRNGGLGTLELDLLATITSDGGNWLKDFCIEVDRLLRRSLS